MSKAVSPLISFVLVIAIAFTAITVLYLGLSPVIVRNLESATVNEGLNNMNLLANYIREVASEGTGGLRTLQLSVTDGSYYVDNASSTLYFNYRLKSGAITPGTYTKQGDVQIVAGGAGASATDNGTNLILENENLKIILQKVGSPTNYASLNTKSNIQSIQNKITGLTIYPKNSSIIIGNDPTSSSGNGYSRLVITGTGLSEADAVFLVNTTNYLYTVTYSLPSLADFITLQIQNTTNTNNTFIFEYNISNNGASDTFNIASNIYNISNITNNACWTGSSISSYFSCSYYNNIFSGLVYSGTSNQFLSTCFSNTTADYTFNLTSNSIQKAIIPLASGTCINLLNSYYLVSSYGQPTTSFGTYSGLAGGVVNLELKLNYPRIILTGDGNTIGRGINKLCISKAGGQNNMPVINIARC